jgi:hypothetical protein
MPPITAASSAKARSPASGVNSSISARTPLRMARDQRLLPGRELGVGGPQQRLRLVAQPPHLLGHVDAARVGGPAQLLDLALEFGDRLFEVQEVAHGAGWVAENAGGRKPLPFRPPAAAPGAVEGRAVTAV